MSERIPMTRQGYDKLKAELDQLISEEITAAADRVGRARSEGDLSENAEYHGARETLSMLEAKANLLRDKLARAEIIDASKLPRDRVVLSATVVVLNLDFDEPETYTLVGAGEEDYDAGRILITSPLAQGFVGKRVGDRVEINVPAGTLRFEILEIRFDGQ